MPSHINIDSDNYSLQFVHIMKLSPHIWPSVETNKDFAELTRAQGVHDIASKRPWRNRLFFWLVSVPAMIAVGLLVLLLVLTPIANHMNDSRHQIPFEGIAGAYIFTGFAAFYCLGGWKLQLALIRLGRRLIAKLIILGEEDQNIGLN